MIFALPTYAFVAAMSSSSRSASGKCATGACPEARVTDPVATGVGAGGVLVSTEPSRREQPRSRGVEAISNGVSAFKPRRSKNAARTLAAMGAGRDLALPRSVLPRRQDQEHGRARASRCSPRSRARSFPPSSGSSTMYFVVQGVPFGDPRPGSEYLVPGLPATGSRARARPVLPAPVREPRRPTGVLERDRGARRRSRSS